MRDFVPYPLCMLLLYILKITIVLEVFERLLRAIVSKGWSVLVRMELQEERGDTAFFAFGECIDDGGFPTATERRNHYYTSNK